MKVFIEMNRHPKNRSPLVEFIGTVEGTHKLPDCELCSEFILCSYNSAHLLSGFMKPECELALDAGKRYKPFVEKEKKIISALMDMKYATKFEIAKVTGVSFETVQKHLLELYRKKVVNREAVPSTTKHSRVYKYSPGPKWRDYIINGE